jgi:hypothetical protein
MLYEILKVFVLDLFHCLFGVLVINFLNNASALELIVGAVIWVILNSAWLLRPIFKIHSPTQMLPVQFTNFLRLLYISRDKVSKVLRINIFVLEHSHVFL